VDEHVLERVEFGALLGNLLGDGFGENLLEEVLEGRFLGLVDHDLHHFLADVLNLGCFGVAGGLDLLVLAAGESNAEKADEISIGGLGLYKSLNKRMPLLDESAELVAGDADTGEVGEAFESFNLLNL